MTIRKAKQLGEQLRASLEVMFINNVAKGAPLAPITVEFRPLGLSADSNTRIFTYFVHWKERRSGVRFDIRKMSKEIEKIFPNVRVTEQFCMFFVSYISIEAKELGKKGNYRFNFEEVRA